MNPNPLYYIMTCGCRMEFSKLLRNGNPDFLTCPDHRGARIDFKETKCIECGETFELYRRSRHAERCPDCTRVRNAEMAKSAKKIREGRPVAPQKNTSKMKAASEENYNCPDREECLTETLKKDRLADYLPCFECEKAIGHRRCA